MARRLRSGRPVLICRAKSALVLGDYGLPHLAIPGTGALFAMQHNGWDHALKVAADGSGLASAMLARSCSGRPLTRRD